MLLIITMTGKKFIVQQRKHFLLKENTPLLLLMY